MTPDPVALTVTVTDEDIRNGERKSCCRCPVALAAYRALGLSPVDGELIVEVLIEVWTGDGWDGYELPPAIIDWIDAFDAGGVVTPVTFTAPYARFLEVT